MNFVIINKDDLNFLKIGYCKLKIDLTYIIATEIFVSFTIN